MGWRIHEAVLVSNGRGDLESLSARSLVARALLAKLKEDGGVGMTLTVAAELGSRASHSLSMLENGLRGRALANGIDLSLNIDTREPRREPQSGHFGLRAAKSA
jgi:hypothetical protein